MDSYVQSRVSTELKLKFQLKFQKKSSLFPAISAEKVHCFQQYHNFSYEIPAIENAVLLSQRIGLP